MQPLNQEEVLDKINNSESFKGFEIGDLNFIGLNFDRSVNFYEAIFTGNTNFSGATFNVNADFSGATFEGITNFSKSTFKDFVYFSEATFNQNANFFEATFEIDTFFVYISFNDDVIFSTAIFKGFTNFSGSTFKFKALFYRTIFAYNTIFPGATFIGIAYFYEVKFLDNVYFSLSIFKGEAVFKGNERSNELEENFVFSSEHLTDFRNVDFQYPEKITFDFVNFKRCLFENYKSQLSKISFHNIEWLVKKKGFLNRFGEQRKIIYDEIYELPPDKNRNYSNIKKIYSQLVKNCEDNRNYDLSEDFHFGEMEMKRLSYNKFFQKFSLLSFYKYLSGYGQNVWLAFFWLLLFVILIFPVSYLHTGIENKKTDNTIKYNFSDNVQFIATPDFWKDYWDSFGHSIAISTLKREKLFESVTTSGNLIEGLQIILVSIQVALCIVTIRRTHRR